MLALATTKLLPLILGGIIALTPVNIYNLEDDTDFDIRTYDSHGRIVIFEDDDTEMHIIIDKRTEIEEFDDQAAIFKNNDGNLEELHRINIDDYNPADEKLSEDQKEILEKHIIFRERYEHEIEEGIQEITNFEEYKHKGEIIENIISNL